MGTAKETPVWPPPHIHKQIIFIFENNRQSQPASCVVGTGNMTTFHIIYDHKIKWRYSVSRLIELDHAPTRPESTDEPDGNCGSIKYWNLWVKQFCLAKCRVKLALAPVN